MPCVNYYYYPCISPFDCKPVHVVRVKSQDKVVPAKKLKSGTCPKSAAGRQPGSCKPGFGKKNHDLWITFCISIGTDCAQSHVCTQPEKLSRKGNRGVQSR